MPHLLATLFPCFPLTPTNGAIRLPTDHQHLSEKAPHPRPTLTNDQAASRIITLMHTAHTDPDHDANIASLVHQAGGWSEYLAAKILAALETVLRAGKDLGPALSAAYERACEAAKGIPGFAADHPLATAVFCTVVALGVLVVLAPYVLEILGFAELGPVEGKESILGLGMVFGEVWLTFCGV